MSEPLRIEIEATNRGALARLQPATVLNVVRLAMDRALPLVHGFISKQRLTGQGPFPPAQHRLGVKTGHLRRGLRWTRAQIVGSTVLASIGDPVRYTGAHEFGFSGSVRVKAHTRRIARIGGQVSTLAAAAKAAKSRKKTAPAVSVGSAQVKAHARHVNLPERAMIRTGLREHLPREFNAALKRELSNLPTS